MAMLGLCSIACATTIKAGKYRTAWKKGEIRDHEKGRCFYVLFMVISEQQLASAGRDQRVAL